MPELSMDQLVSQFAEVLTAMTESEASLLNRLRSLRQVEQGNGLFANQSPPPVANVGSTPVGTLAPATFSNQHSVLESFGPPAGAQRESASPATPPEAPLTPASSVAGHRDYDYFAELDEKLSGLRQRYLE